MGSGAVLPRLLGRNMVMDYKFEVVVLPVGDVDRAKAFYTSEVAS